MNSRIYSNKELIGTDNLEVGDDSMGCLFGEFRPNEKYFQIAQNVIREFWKTQKPDYSKLKSLRLNVQLDNQYFLYPAGGITIEDSIEFPDEPLIIDLAGLDRIIFEEFINKTELPNFVEKPWNPLSIEEKIDLENQLFIEMGIESETKSWLNIFKTKQISHVL